MPLKHLAFLVLFYLGGGVFTTFGCLRHKDVGPAYFRIHGLGTGVLLFLAFWLLGPTASENGFAIGFSLFLLCVFGFSFFTGVSTRLSIISYFLGLICFYGALHLDLSQLQLAADPTLLFINSVLSSLILGFSMGAMMLGHWYLTQPKLSIDELKRLTWLLISFIGIKFIFSSYQSLLLLKGMTEVQLLHYLVKVPGVFVLMRYVWGLLGSLLLSFLVWKTVKIRSTQSATGILYVVVVACLVGEILSLYLAFHFGIPL